MIKGMALVFIFIDGIGLGSANNSNPFYTADTPFFSTILEGSSLCIEAADKDYRTFSLLALDATLGVEGLPQSATGQATLFTGENAPSLLGYHLHGFPNQELQELLKEKGMFKCLRERFLKATFANAFRPFIFEDLKEGFKGSYSCSTLVNYYAGLPFRSLHDLHDGRAVYMDITNRLLPQMGFEIAAITPQQAGERLACISRDYHLTFYEHFITDIAGHKGVQGEAEEAVKTLDAFLAAVAASLDLQNDTLVVTSDHGNLENIKNRVHTDNPVPALIAGKDRQRVTVLLREQKNIGGVFPALQDILSPLNSPLSTPNSFHTRQP